MNAGLERPLPSNDARRLRVAYALLCIATVPTGLTVRFAHLGLPWFVVKYGGSTLWAVMVYWVLALLWPGLGSPTLASIAGLISACAEFQRLYHAPWLNAFRATLAGILLFGSHFSWWDILAYAIAIATAALLDALLVRPMISRERT